MRQWRVYFPFFVTFDQLVPLSTLHGVAVACGGWKEKPNIQGGGSLARK